MATIAIVHFALQGHFGAATRLARVLVEHGHRVVALAPENLRDETEAVGASLRPLGDPYLPRRGAPEMRDGNSWDLAAGMARHTAQIVPPTVELLHEEGVDVVVNDAQAPWGRIAADWLGLPSACSWPLFPPAVVTVTPDSPKPPEFGDAAREAIEASRQAIGRRWGVAMGDEGSALRSLGDVNLAYTTPEIGGDRLATDESWRLVGPLMRPAEPGPDDGGPPLVYVALGTVYAPNASVFRVVLDALADEPVRVLAATWDYLAADDLAPLPANAEVAGRVDSTEVLRRAALHVTHGGANSSHESVMAGVPMLFLPQGSDNPHWAERFAAAGAGAVVEDPSVEAVRAGVRRLLGDAEARRRTLALRDRVSAYDGAAIAVEAIEALVREPAGLRRSATTTS